MKKSVLAQIREKYGVVRDEVSASSVGEAYRAAREATRIMKVSNVRDMVWQKKRDACQKICGLKPDENGCYNYDEIDMKNPIVEIEYFLCDPSNRAHTSQHLPMEKRKKYIEDHLSPEAADLFWHPEKGAQYDRSGTPYNMDGWTPWHKLEFRFGDVRRAFGGKGGDDDEGARPRGQGGGICAEHGRTGRRAHMRQLLCGLGNQTVQGPRSGGRGVCKGHIGAHGPGHGEEGARGQCVRACVQGGA